jgi:hypothetical protein
VPDESGCPQTSITGFSGEMETSELSPDTRRSRVSSSSARPVMSWGSSESRPSRQGGLNVELAQDRTDSARSGLVLTVQSNLLTSILDCT